jgi:hypothetical protein
MNVALTVPKIHWGMRAKQLTKVAECGLNKWSSFAPKHEKYPYISHGSGAGDFRSPRAD